MALEKLSAINGGASTTIAPSTDQLVGVRSGTTDLLFTGVAVLGTAQTFTALQTMTAGLTVSGAVVSINHSSNFNTVINDGTSTGTVTIGNSSSGALALASGAASTITVTAANLTISTATSGTLAITSAGLLTLTGVGASVWTPGAGATIVSDTTTGIKFGTATNQKLGWFNSSPVVQQTDGAGLTNNAVASGTTNQIDDFTSLTVYATDAQAIHNDIYQLARKVKIVDDALRLYGLLS
jgi:hypothetical protein